MKSLLYALVMFVAMFAASSTARAEREVSLQDGALIVKESTLVMRVPNVPKGLSANNAYNLVTGWSKEATIEESEFVKLIFSFSFPLIRAQTEHPGWKVTFPNGRWLEEPVNRTTDWGDGRVLTALSLWLPTILIVAVSILNSLCKRKIENEKKWLVAFYAAIFCGVSASAFFSFVSPNKGLGIVVGMIFGGLASGITGGMATKLSCNPPSVLLGMLAGALVGTSAGMLADTQNYVLLVQYCVFLFAVMVISFAIAKAIDRAKKKRLEVERVFR